VQLRLPVEGRERYKSRSQLARIATEAWGAENLYCPNCDSPRLAASTANTPAIDYSCPQCRALFQLKAQSHVFAGRIVDAAYSAMLETIRRDRVPNLVALHYAADRWEVLNLFLVPRFAFSVSVLEKRKPLSSTARRAGWVGCNILLSRIPANARIALVRDGVITKPSDVRRQYHRLRPLAELSVENRGWFLDVLNVVQSLDKKEFTLGEAYAFEPQLSKLHPNNRRVRPKIRQQLQVLRDKGFIDFLGGGSYRLR
jgi:type II restriction enzyme